MVSETASADPGLAGHGPSVGGRKGRGTKSRRREDAGAKIAEYVFIVPVVALVLAGIVQCGGLFLLQSDMTEAAEVAAQALAQGRIRGEAAAQRLVVQTLGERDMAFSVDARLPDPSDRTAKTVTVVVTTPLSEAASFDFLGIFEDGNLRASATTGPGS